MSDDLHGAILQRDKKTYAIVPRIPAGILTLENLEAIAAVVKKYNIPITKITSGHRLALVGIEKDDIEKVPLAECAGKISTRLAQRAPRRRRHAVNRRSVRSPEDTSTRPPSARSAKMTRRAGTTEGRAA